MKNDRVRAKLMEKPAVPLFLYTDLLRDRRELVKGAEKMLRWNTDKGAVG